MVKFRGIDVNIVSQFDIQKLPEFRPLESNDPFHQKGPALRSDDNSVASCYVPIYLGSQIWLEYSIEAPHPQDASYFFKMLHNSHVVTSWDCTAKHGYRGKTAYNIQYIGNDNSTGMPLVRRQAFKFSPADHKDDVGLFDDCIEIRVHRIEHRERVALESSLNDAQPLESSYSGGLCIVNSGPLEPGCPQRRYCYQLLDPTDEPYATIRFYYRSYAFLEDQNIVSSPAKSYRSTSASPSGYGLEGSTSLPPNAVTSIQEHKHTERDSPRRALSTSITPPPAYIFQTAGGAQQRACPESKNRILLNHCPPTRCSEKLLRILAKDSLEDFHASPLHVEDGSPIPAVDDMRDAARKETSITSPRKLQKKSLTLKIDGADFKLERKKRRPLSPFNSAGALRRMTSPTPPSAPAAVTEFGPSVAEEVEAQLAREKEFRKLEKALRTNVGTTRAERGGKVLLGFLGRRIGRTQ